MRSTISFINAAALPLLAASLLAGCQNQAQSSVPAAPFAYKSLVDGDITQATANCVADMIADAKPNGPGFTGFNPNAKIAYFSGVNLNDYDQTSNFGRLIAEGFTSAMVRMCKGDVMRMTVRDADIPILNNQPSVGEFSLSRDVRELALDHNVETVMVSTYSETPDRVYVNVQLINVHHKTIVGVGNFTLPKGPLTTALLRNLTTMEEATPSIVNYNPR